MSDSKHTSDVSFIQALAEMLRKNDLTEIEVRREYGEDDVLDVRVARQMQSAPVMMQAPAAAPAAIARGRGASSSPSSIRARPAGGRSDGAPASGLLQPTNRRKRDHAGAQQRERTRSRYLLAVWATRTDQVLSRVVA